MFRKEPATITLQNYRFNTLFLTLSDLLACTVTCRQFPNLTFAPRKTCHEAATSRFIAIMPQHLIVYMMFGEDASVFLFFSSYIFSTISATALHKQEQSFPGKGQNLPNMQK